jgi:hypothetical protein
LRFRLCKIRFDPKPLAVQSEPSGYMIRVDVIYSQSFAFGLSFVNLTNDLLGLVIIFETMEVVAVAV